MIYKCTNISQNRLDLIDADGNTYSIELSDSITGRELGDMHKYVANITYNCIDHYKFRDIDYEYFHMYNMLRSSSTNKSDKAYNKALILGSLYDKDLKVQPECTVITDRNNILSREHIRLWLNTAYFIGSKPLERENSKAFKVVCNKAIIDNPCVYAKIIPDSGMSIYAETFVIKHPFTDLRTIYESLKIILAYFGLNLNKYVLNRSITGLHFIPEHGIDAEMCQKIVIRFKNRKITNNLIYEYVKELYCLYYNADIENGDYTKIYNIDTALLFWLISMWETSEYDERVKILVIKHYEKLKNDIKIFDEADNITNFLRKKVTIATKLYKEEVLKQCNY